MYILYFFYNIQKNKEIFTYFSRIKNRELIKLKNIIENYKSNNNA